MSTMEQQQQRNAPVFSAMLRRRAREQSKDLALWCNGEALNYGSLVKDAENIAKALRDIGATPGNRIAIIARPSLDYCRALMGILLARCVVVPLSTTLPGDTLAALLADAEPFAIFADRDGARSLDAARYEGPRFGIGDCSGTVFAPFSWLAPSCNDTPLPEQRGDDLFSIIYSSGTTGIPKGIAHDTRARSEFFSLGAAGDGTRVLLTTALFTNASFCTLLATLYLGGACFIEERFDSRKFIEFVEQQQINSCFLVPVQFRRILAEPSFSADRLGSLKKTIISGSHCPLSLKTQLSESWPGDLIESYGLSEGGVLTQLNVTRTPAKLRTVGTLLPGYEMFVVGEDDKPVPSGTAGEIVGRSPYVMRGYFNRDDLTEAMNWRDEKGRLFQRTGDVGWVDAEGYVYISDRKKDIIISGGMNIHAAEIDQLLEQHPHVLEAAVIAAPSERWGETPAAYVVLRPGAVISSEALLEWINARVAREMRVSAIEFVDVLPRNAMGKVMKRELRDKYRVAHPDG